VLRHAAAHPELLRWTDNVRLLDTLEQAGLLPAADAAVLRDGYRAYRARVHRLALQEVDDAVVDGDEYREPRAAVTALWSRIVGSR
jgi:[glutamine synthetase] adenylyltransferase / [glutamine synthetase]-adenylyl-L-tyrosine phosphorylase